ncbi:MAG: ATP-binding cassette domain-containing protein, partial [Hungatella sp.]
MILADLLEMKDICKQFSGTNVLTGVDFDLNHGELHALVGENGAGKSTLIKVLAGVHQANSGRVVLEGKEVLFKNPKEAINAGVSTIH